MTAASSNACASTNFGTKYSADRYTDKSNVFGDGTSSWTFECKDLPLNFENGVPAAPMTDAFNNETCKLDADCKKEPAYPGVSVCCASYSAKSITTDIDAKTLKVLNDLGLPATMDAKASNACTAYDTTSDPIFSGEGGDANAKNTWNFKCNKLSSVQGFPTESKTWKSTTAINACKMKDDCAGLTTPIADMSTCCATYTPKTIAETVYAATMTLLTNLGLPAT